MPYTLVVCDSGAWGVPDGTSCVLPGPTDQLAQLIRSLGQTLGVTELSQLEYFDTDFGEWCRLELVSELPCSGDPVKVRLPVARGIVPAAVLNPGPETEPEPDPEPQSPLEEIAETAEEAVIEAEEAVKMAAFALARGVSGRRGGVSSLRQTADVVAEADAAQRAVAAASAASSGGIVEEDGSRLLVLELVCGARLPAKDFSIGGMQSFGDIVNRTSDPYAFIQLLDQFGSPVGPRRRSPTKLKTLAPVWRFFCDFPLVGHAAAATHVRIDVWDYDLGRQDDFMCTALVALPALVDEPRRFGASKKHGVSTDAQQVDSKHKGPQLVLRRVPARPADSLTIFFVRHAESEWNRAKREKDLHGLMKQVNHPLSKAGIEQCWKFNTELREAKAKMTVVQGFGSDIAEGGSGGRLAQLSAAEAIFASPLTRATQTCILAFQGHAALKQGLTLLAAGRETKNFGGQDTVGDQVGSAVLKTAHAQAASRLGFADVAAAEVAASAWHHQQQQQLLQGKASQMVPPQHQPPPVASLLANIGEADLHQGSNDDLHPEAAQRLGACFGSDSLGPVDHLDAESPWWTEWADAEDKDATATRQYAFLAAARYHITASERTSLARWRRLRGVRAATGEGDGARGPRRRAVVIVSHSHWIRKFCDTYIPACGSEPADDAPVEDGSGIVASSRSGGRARLVSSAVLADPIAMQLRTTNIGNACCVALDIDFTAPHGDFGAPDDPRAAAAAAVSGERGVDAAMVVGVEPILDFQFKGLEAEEIVPGSQLHVRGIGVHGWDGTPEGVGAFESEPALRTVFARFGHMVQATVRHRIDEVSGANTSWALVTMLDKASAERAVEAAVVGGPGVYAGTQRLVVTRFSKSVADSSTGQMSTVRKEDRAKTQTKKADGASGDESYGLTRPCDGAVAAGWLEKISAGKLARNKRRFFVFDPKAVGGRHGVAYYADESCEKLEGVMDLSFCYAVRKSARNSCELEVVTPQRTWRLIAPDYMECLVWRQVMSGCAGIQAGWEE